MFLLYGGVVEWVGGAGGVACHLFATGELAALHPDVMQRMQEEGD